MAKKPKKSEKAKTEEKKPNRMVRLSEQDHEALSRLADKNGRTLTMENHRALQDYLRKHGELPPEDPAQK